MKCVPDLPNAIVPVQIPKLFISFKKCLIDWCGLNIQIIHHIMYKMFEWLVCGLNTEIIHHIIIQRV